MNEPSSGTSERLRKYPAIAGCAGSSRADGPHAVGRELHDRPAGGDDHDHEDEHRLDEVPAVQVGGGGAPAIGERHEQEQHEGPEAEDGFDFSQQVPQPRVRGARVRKMLEVAGGEGVQDRQREQRGADNFKGSDYGQSCRESTAVGPGASVAKLVRKSAYLPSGRPRRKMRFADESPSISARCGGLRALLRRARLGQLHRPGRPVQHHAVESATRARHRLDDAGRPGARPGRAGHDRACGCARSAHAGRVRHHDDNRFRSRGRLRGHCMGVEVPAQGCRPAFDPAAHDLRRGGGCRGRRGRCSVHRGAERVGLAGRRPASARLGYASGLAMRSASW